MSYGFRVYPRANYQDFDADRILKISTTDLSDAMNSTGTVSTKIRPLNLGRGTRIVGRALTISVPTASVAMLRVGMQMAEPGDIIVVNGAGNENSTLVGGNMLSSVRNRGVAGFIADGAVRDLEEIRDTNFPVFARGVTMRGGPNGPDVGEVNVPISCGNTVVNPGDIVVADGDGVVFLPETDLNSILESAEALQAHHESMYATIAQGDIFGAKDTRESLAAAGCEFVE